MIPDRLSCHHKDSTFGRTRSCHHTNPIAGRTVDMSICPATTCTQTWGGRSTYHRMNSIKGRSICRESHRANTPILLDVEPFQCRQTNLIPIWFHNRCFIDGMIIPNIIPGIWMKWKSLPRFCSFQFLKAKLGHILYIVIEGYLNLLHHCFAPCTTLCSWVPFFCSPCKTFCSSCTRICSFCYHLGV